MPQPDSMNDVPPKLHFDEDNDGKPLTFIKIGGPIFRETIKTHFMQGGPPPVMFVGLYTP